MSVRAARHQPDQPGPRHDPGWYDQGDEVHVLAAGDRPRSTWSYTWVPT